LRAIFCCVAFANKARTGRGWEKDTVGRHRQRGWHTDRQTDRHTDGRRDWETVSVRLAIFSHLGKTLALAGKCHTVIKRGARKAYLK